MSKKRLEDIKNKAVFNHFSQPLTVPVSDRLYELIQHWNVYWTFAGVEYRYRVPKGFITDIATIPWLARWLIEKDGTHRGAAVAHDSLYYHQGKVPKGFYQYKNAEGVWVDHQVTWSKMNVDRFFGALIREGQQASLLELPGQKNKKQQLGFWAKRKRDAMVWAVRWFGEPFWRSVDTKQKSLFTRRNQFNLLDEEA